MNSDFKNTLQELQEHQKNIIEEKNKLILQYKEKIDLLNKELNLFRIDVETL